MTFYANQHNDKGFTLMEIMAVVIIVGILSSFAIPNYTRAIERAHRRDATANLTSIHSANQIFRSERGEFWPTVGGPQDLTAINTGLRLAIISNGMTYQCQRFAVGVPPGQYTCTAARDTGAYTLSVTEAPIGAGNPSCAPAAACP